MGQKVMTMGDKLRYLREKKHLTQVEMGKKLNVTRCAYQFYEAGDREPNRQNLLKLADSLGVSVDVLINDEICLIDNTTESHNYGRKKKDDQEIINIVRQMTYDEYWNFYSYGVKLLENRNKKSDT